MITVNVTDNELRRRLDKLAEQMEDYLVVFDIDGTLCRFKYTGEDLLLPCNNEDLGKYLSYANNMYTYAEPIKSMQYLINKLDPSKVMTLSTAVPMAVLLKVDWLEKYYPSVLPSNTLWTKCDEDKLKVLQKLSKDNKVLFIDDSYKTLLFIEENDKSIKLMHTSMFIL
jgi:hypothetical protein